MIVTQTFEHSYQTARTSSLLTSVIDFAERRRAVGYSAASMKSSLVLVRNFAVWLDRQTAPGDSISPDVIAEYLGERRLQKCRRRGDIHTLRQFISFVQAAAPLGQAKLAPEISPADKVLEAFEYYLRDERGLAEASIRLYADAVARFLGHTFGSGDVQLVKLTPADIVQFVQADAASLNHSKRAQVMTSALRSFLQYARCRGEIAADLHASVPTVANWSKTGLPRSISPVQVQRLLTACDRRTPTGRRDYAILMLLTRLGLRGGEVAELRLEDLDWDAAVIRVRGPAQRSDSMPLPVDVGAALAAYLRDGRPPCAARNVFVRARAPVQPLRGPSAVACIVCRALRRVGIDTPFKGAHLLRHSLATQMLGEGASLGEIGQILRHRNVQTTTIYAKVDLGALRTLALPWPGDAP
jgi:site-specific recombinase XerD